MMWYSGMRHRQRFRFVVFVAGVVVVRLGRVFRGGRRRFVSFGLGRRMRMDFWRG